MGDGEAADSSDEEQEMAPDKMEVDNDQDREWLSLHLLLHVFLLLFLLLFLSLGDSRQSSVRPCGHGHLLPLGHSAWDSEGSA